MDSQQTTILRELVVPPEYKEDINPYSGYLNQKSKYGHKNLKGLFRAPVNVKYLGEQLHALITIPNYVQDRLSGMSDEVRDANSESDNHLVSDTKFGWKRPTLRNLPHKSTHTRPSKRAMQIVHSFKPKRREIMAMTPGLVEEFVLPYAEDTTNSNPIMELHHINLDFLVTTANGFIQNPALVDARMRDWNPDTGRLEGGPGEGVYRDYEYNASSWNEGTWHPEHLFTESTSNRKTSYWAPLRVEFHNSPFGYPPDPNGVGDEGGRGPGNRYKHIAVRNPDLMNVGLEGGPPGTSFNEEGELVNLESFRNIPEDPNEPLNLHSLVTNDPQGLYDTAGPGRPWQQPNPRMRLFSNGGQFPFWQTRVHDRPYDRDNSEALREGGISDRRTQVPHGYDMTKLITRPQSRQKGRK